MIYFFPLAKSIGNVRGPNPWIDNVCSRIKSRETMRGPGDQMGLLVADGSVADSDIKHDPQSQVWSRRFGSDAWIGFDRLNPPGPVELARPQLTSGLELELLDGRQWVIPQLCQYDPEQMEGPLQYACRLERRLVQDSQTGRLTQGDVIPKYADLWGMALEIGNEILQQLLVGPASLEDEQIETFCAGLLGLNYRVELPEISALGLLSPGSFRRIVQIGIDWDTLETNLKNRQSRLSSGGTNTERGETQPTEA